MRSLSLTLSAVILALALHQVYGSYWDMPWTALHDRPVFRMQPSIKWNFTHASAPYSSGKIVINDDTGDILVPNGNSDVEGPLFFILNKDGKEVMAWNTTNSPQARCSGTITHRQGVVYVFSDITCELFAVSVASGELLWNNTQLCPEDVEYQYSITSSTPITWLKDDTVMLIVTARRVITVRASDGEILMSHGPVTDYTSLMPPISSRVDDNFIFHASNGTVFSLNVETGQVAWTTQVVPGKSGYSDTPPPPAVDEDGSIYVPTYSGLVHKLFSNGTRAWSTSYVSGLAGVHSAPVLVNSSHIVVTAGYHYLAFFLVRRSDGQISQLRTDADREFGDFRSQLYWNENVFYTVVPYGEFSAWDTTDLNNVTLLWRLDLQAEFSRIESGPSIMKDGTIIIASGSNYQQVVNLIAIGCPDGSHISSDGLQCLCDAGKELENDMCVQCPPNQVSNGSACQECQAGSVPNDNQSDCSSCPANTFSRAGDVTCSPCSDEPTNGQCNVAQPISSPTNQITSSASQNVYATITVLFALTLFCWC